MTKDDPVGERNALPLNPTLTPHLNPAVPDARAGEGPAPADLASREAPHVPAPSEEHLSAEQVGALLGGDQEAVDANRALAAAEGVDPDTES